MSAVPSRDHVTDVGHRSHSDASSTWSAPKRKQHRLIRGAFSGRRIRLADIGHGGTVGCNGRTPQVGIGFVGDDRPFTGADVDAHQHSALRRPRRRLQPAGDHESTVRAEVEVGVAQRASRRGREIGRRTGGGRIETEQMQLAGPKIGVPVSNWIAGVQDRGDLVVLATVPQPAVVVQVLRRRQHWSTHDCHGCLARGAHRPGAAQCSRRGRRRASTPSRSCPRS
jgi:hypothetical protein